MLEMVQYILRFIITMKHVIYGAILSAARGLGECCKLTQQGLGLSPRGNQIWCILAWKSDIWWHQFFIFPDFSLTFPKKYFFSWPFPDHSNSLTFSSFPWPVGTLCIMRKWDLVVLQQWQGWSTASCWSPSVNSDSVLLLHCRRHAATTTQ